MPRKFLTISIALALAAYFLISLFTSTALAVTLGINGNAFTVDGQKKFLVLATYFDGLDSQNPSADLNYLKSKGFDGIRIMPNWWESTSPLTFSNNTLIDGNGNARQTRLAKLRQILDAADALGMIVDITFTIETVPGPCLRSTNDPNNTLNTMCMGEFKRGVVSVIQSLSGYTNVFYDLQNESDGANKLTKFCEYDISNNWSCTDGGIEANLRDLVNRIRSSAGSAPILSTSFGGTAADSNSVATNTGLNIANWHIVDGENSTAYQRALTGISAVSRPTYIGEPWNTSWNGRGATTQQFIDRATAAKRAGLSAWTFHLQGPFYLNNTSFQSSLNSAELGFVDSFKSIIDTTQWGSGGDINPPDSTCINQAPSTSTVPNMLSVTQQVAAEHRDWLENSCNDYRFVDEVVSRLRSQTGSTRWAFECKRANCNDPWKEGIAYYYGAGDAPQPGSMDNYEVFGIDVAHQDCGNPAGSYADWSVADWPNRSSGLVQVAYLYPRTAGGSLPSPVMCSAGGGGGDGGGGGGGGGTGGGGGGGSNQQPQPQPDILLPAIIGANPNTAKPGNKIEIFGVNLGNTVILESANGQRVELSGSLNSDKTRVSIDLPSGLNPGTYDVTVIRDNFSDSKPGLLTVSTTSAPILPAFGPIQNLGDLIQTIFQWALWLVGLAVFVNFLWAGILWLTAAGRSGPIAQAKEKMWNALIGAIILLASYLILNTINPDLVKQTFTLPGLR